MGYQCACIENFSPRQVKINSFPAMKSGEDMESGECEREKLEVLLANLNDQANRTIPAGNFMLAIVVELVGDEYRGSESEEQDDGGERFFKFVHF